MYNIQVTCITWEVYIDSYSGSLVFVVCMSETLSYLHLYDKGHCMKVPIVKLKR